MATLVNLAISFTLLISVSCPPVKFPLVEEDPFNTPRLTNISVLPYRHMLDQIGRIHWEAYTTEQPKRTWPKKAYVDFFEVSFRPYHLGEIKKTDLARWLKEDRCHKKLKKLALHVPALNRVLLHKKKSSEDN